MEKKVKKDINTRRNDFLQSFDMAYKRRRRMSRKGGCSKNNPTPFAVSLKSRKRKSVTTNSQVHRGKFGKSQQKGGFIGAILAATAPLWLPLAVKRVKKILH